jgi:hypothetical protein
MLWLNDVFRKSNTGFLIWIGAAVAISNTGWRVVMNNFAVDVVGMDGDTLGVLQSLREIPGLLAFTVLFWLMFIKEQRMAIISLAILGIGVSITGMFPSIYGFYFTTVIMSIGFHYLESLSSSLTTQFYTQSEFNERVGQLRSADSFFGIIGFVLILSMLNIFNVTLNIVFLASGVSAVLIALYLSTFQQIKTTTPPQKNKPVLRKKYKLYYLLTFLAGARRQIFVVFAGFLLVEKFNFSASNMAVLFFIAHIVTVFFAPKIGVLVTRLGPKRTLSLEYIIITLIFILYSQVESQASASILYILDALAFSLSIALRSYFKSIATPDDISATTSVSFTINHIAAVFLPFILGAIWIEDYKIVFYTGAAFSIASVIVVQFIRKEHEYDPVHGKLTSGL